MVMGKKKGYKEVNVDKQQKPDGIFGSLRPGSLLFLALILSALVLAALPGSAMIADDTVTAPAADQSLGCPCNGQCGPQQAPPIVEPQSAEAGTINQPAPATNNPPAEIQNRLSIHRQLMPRQHPQVNQNLHSQDQLPLIKASLT
jgi:hypothetical protein